MTERRQDTWEITFPIEATVFVLTLVGLALAIGLVLLARPWYTGMTGGGVDFVGRPVPLPADGTLPIEPELREDGADIDDIVRVIRTRERIVVIEEAPVLPVVTTTMP